MWVLFQYQRYQLLWEQFQLGTQQERLNASCSEYQRYQLLRAIHNYFHCFVNSKSCSEYQRYQLESNSQHGISDTNPALVVPNIKDINFESNSQPHVLPFHLVCSISWYQLESNSQLFDIIEMVTVVVPNIKDINFESNSQLGKRYDTSELSCSEYQRYQLLRAIHN